MAWGARQAIEEHSGHQFNGILEVTAPTVHPSQRLWPEASKRYRPAQLTGAVLGCWALRRRSQPGLLREK